MRTSSRGVSSGLPPAPAPAAARPGGSEDLDLAAKPRRVGQATVGGDERAVDSLCECDVAAVVRRQVLPELPHPLKKRTRRKYRDREGEQIADCPVCLFLCQSSPVGVPSKDRGDFDPQEVRPYNGLALESASEPSSVAPSVGKDGSED